MPSIYYLRRRLREQMGTEYCFGTCSWLDADLIRLWLRLTRTSYWRRRYLCSACITEIETLAGIDDITKLDLRTRETNLLIERIQTMYFDSDEYHGGHAEDELGW